jgi:hypothetical protein
MSRSPFRVQLALNLQGIAPDQSGEAAVSAATERAAMLTAALVTAWVLLSSMMLIAAFITAPSEEC